MMPLFSPGARCHPNLRLSKLTEKMHAHLRSSINNNDNFRAPDVSWKNFSGGLISKEPTKFVAKISVNSRCNRVYQE